MINKFQITLLKDVDSELQKARFKLDKSVIYLEAIEHNTFTKTIDELKKVIKDLHNSSNEIIDFVNEQGG